MKIQALEVLRCPFCGGRLRQHPTKSFEICGDEVETSLLGCACCAYPVVAGIPYLRTGQTARTVLGLLDGGHKDQALQLLLGLGTDGATQIEALKLNNQQFTYRTCLKLLSPNPEGAYFLYRFSDPTFLVTDGLLRAIAPKHIGLGPILDLGGGSGHLARTITTLSAGQPVWLADLEFWKLWLARQFVAPECHVVCCDAAQPLPFARGSFSLALSSDAFNYIWPRRSLVGEMRRLVGPEGIVMATHLHNALCENCSEGAHLDPEGWRALFEEVPAVLFKESAVLDSVLQNTAIDLSINNGEGLAAEPALIALSTMCDGFFRQYNPPEFQPVFRRPAINPLYHCEDDGVNKALKLSFPSPFYESEFEACRRYLPERLEFSSSEFKSLGGTALQGRWGELARKHVLLDLPENYL